MRGLLLAGVAGVALWGGCVAGPQEAPVQKAAAPGPERSLPYVITAYEAQEEGEKIPPWVSRYLEGGAWAVEELPEYTNRYIFIAVNSGPNDRLLRQWAENFSPVQDFARMAAARLELRFSQAATAYPEDEYGGFFIQMIRAASDGFYGGAERKGDFWIRRRYFEEDGVTVNREEYDFLILITMDKFLFERRVHDILKRIKPDPPPSREQAAAIRRALDSLFDKF